MIILVESVPIARIGLLRKQRIIITNSVVLGMKVMVMTIPIAENLRAWQRERIKRRAIALLGKLRINTVCLRKDFPYPEWFQAYRKPTGSDFIKRFFGKIAVMSAKKHDSVYVFLKHIDRASQISLADLCEEFRFVYITGQNSEAIRMADNLLSEYGASVIIDPTPERIKTVDAVVFFDDPTEAPMLNECCVVIGIESSDVEFCMSDGSDLNIPDGFSQNALISESILRGCIRFEDVKISRLKIYP